jgi:hypothetical protein
MYITGTFVRVCVCHKTLPPGILPLISTIMVLIASRRMHDGEYSIGDSDERMISHNQMVVSIYCLIIIIIIIV